jgi:copper chaperone CopZ
MKHLLLSLTLLAGSAAAVAAAETQNLSSRTAAQKTYRYEGTIAGVVCAACSSSVKDALMNLKGVKEVRITVSNDGQLPSLHILSTSPNLTLQAAMSALGSSASDYQIQTLNKTALPN